MVRLKKGFRIQNFTLLLLNDDQQSRDALQEAFEGLNIDYDLKWFKKSEGLFSYLDKTYADSNQVIVLDLQFKREDGFHILYKLKQSYHSNIPVVIYTGESNPGTKDKALKMGAEMFFSKPSDFEKNYAIASRIQHLAACC